MPTLWKHIEPIAFPFIMIGGTALIILSAIIAVIWLGRRSDRFAAVMRHPMSKYVALSLLAHLALGIAAYVARIQPVKMPTTTGPTIAIQFVDEATFLEADSHAAAEKSQADSAQSPDRLAATEVSSDQNPLPPDRFADAIQTETQTDNTTTPDALASDLQTDISQENSFLFAEGANPAPIPVAADSSAQLANPNQAAALLAAGSSAMLATDETTFEAPPGHSVAEERSPLAVESQGETSLAEKSLVTTSTDVQKVGELEAASAEFPATPVEPFQSPAANDAQNTASPEMADALTPTTAEGSMLATVEPPSSPEAMSAESERGTGDSPMSAFSDQPVSDYWVPPVAENANDTREAMSAGPNATQVSSRSNHELRSDTPLSALTAPRRSDGKPIPMVYRDRFSRQRAELAARRGGDEQTEAAVQAALGWLAKNQHSDGRWDASQFGAGRMGNVDGQDRNQAGMDADVGITGLALLAFLGSGHTHQAGPYQSNVALAIDYLMVEQQQRTDGALIGNARFFAAMYCHGIATFALSEAYTLTGDERLGTAVRRAIQYTIGSQDVSGGGWRYRAHEPGDTSQFGWQIMALTSAHFGGISIPATTWQRSGTFLNSVSSGNYGGRAAYRPGYGASRPMTAEALMCRLYLRTPPEHPLVTEAVEYVMQELPGDGLVNYYYWYYATLSLYQLQNSDWTRWNHALKQTLITRQQTEGVEAGSWNPDSVWGASGGRVYSTALAALTLEVYYRYQPLVPERQPERTAWRVR